MNFYHDMCRVDKCVEARNDACVASLSLSWERKSETDV